MPSRYGRRRFSKKFTGKKRTFSRKRTGFKKVLKRQMGSRKKLINLARREKLAIKGLMQPQRYVVNWMDSVLATGTTNAAAKQIMWASGQNQSVSSGASGASIQPFVNLGLFDGQVIQLAMAAGNSVTGNNTVAGLINTCKMLINKYRTQMRVKNITSGEVELVHYRCRLMKDLSSTSSTQGSIQSLITNTAAATAFGSATTNVKTPILSTDYSCRPFDIPNLCKFVHIKSSKSYFLKPNQARVFSYTRSKPKLVNWLDYQFPTSASSTNGAPDATGATAVAREMVKGATFSIFVLRGTVATDSAANTNFKYGIGNADVLVQAKAEIDYQVVAPNYQTSALYQGIQGYSSGACGYPLPLTGVYQVIDTVNTTTGARVPITSNADVIPDVSMIL